MVPFSVDALERLGAVLQGRGLAYRLVVVGGAALDLRGVLGRTTTDVDIIAIVDEGRPGVLLAPPDPLPAPLLDAVRRVADDLALAPDWLNARVAAQGDTSRMPNGMIDRLEWREFGGLGIGIAGRFDLIALKLHAAVDNGDIRSKHYQDLLRLAPSEQELMAATSWVIEQDAGDNFAQLVHQVVARVRHDTR